MFRGVAVVVVVVVASLTAAGVVSADRNEAPVAAAGLDQQVPEGSMVYLDAGGSFDPDGNITSHKWEITAPNGTTISPDCPSCAQTRFRAGQSGTYDVTVTVTDDEGMTRSDTLHVEARAVEAPSVSVTGPAVIQNETAGSFEATVTAGDRELEWVVWSVDGGTVARQSVDGERAEKTLRYTATETGQQTIRVQALDRAGNTENARHVFDVDGNSSDSTRSSAESTGSSDSSGNNHSPLDRTGNPNGAYELRLDLGNKVTAGDGNEIVLDQNDIRFLLSQSGVEKGTAYTNTGADDALIITNPRIKQDIDDDAGLTGQGFTGDSLENLRTGKGSSYEYQPKFQATDPGTNWVREGERFLDTKTRPNKVSKPGWEYQGNKYVGTGETYTAYNARSEGDRQVGMGTETTYGWQDTAHGGEVVDTRQEFSHYTWDETITTTNRVRTGTRTVGYDKEYDTVIKTELKTRRVCEERRTFILGGDVCVEWGQENYIETERIRTVVDKEPITEPVYHTVSTTRSISQSGTNPPWGSDISNVESHYETEYKIKSTVSKPLWEEYDKKYVYDVYEYKWVRK